MVYLVPSITPTSKALERDNLDRLTLAHYSINDSNEAFTMDDLGNRDSVVLRDDSNVDYVIDANTNRYTEIDGNSLAYNNAGGLATDKDDYTYEYDYENRITKIKKSGATKAEFAYDALGRRIKKVDSVAGATTIYYNNDKWQVLCEYNGAGTAQRWFAYGNYIDEVLAMNTSTFPLIIKFFVHDHLFSPVALVNRYQLNLVERYEYDAYGNCQILSPTYQPRATSSYSNPYFFTGRTLDILDNGNLKIQYNRNRYYDTYTGRFFTHDPMGYVDGVNLYEYARSSPVTLADPRGESAACPCTAYPWFDLFSRSGDWVDWSRPYCFTSERVCFEVITNIGSPIDTMYSICGEDLEGQPCAPHESTERNVCKNIRLGSTHYESAGRCRRYAIRHFTADIVNKLYECKDGTWAVWLESTRPIVGYTVGERRQLQKIGRACIPREQYELERRGRLVL